MPVPTATTGPCKLVLACVAAFLHVVHACVCVCVYVCVCVGVCVCVRVDT